MNESIISLSCLNRGLTFKSLRQITCTHTDGFLNLRSRSLELWFPSQYFRQGLSNQLGVKTQIKRTDSSWGSHNSQIGSASQMTLLHNPSNSKLYSDMGIGSHSLYAQDVCVKGECKIAKKNHTQIYNNFFDPIVQYLARMITKKYIQICNKTHKSKNKGEINIKKNINSTYLINWLDSLTSPHGSRHLSQPKSRRDGD